MSAAASLRPPTRFSTTAAARSLARAQSPSQSSKTGSGSRRCGRPQRCDAVGGSVSHAVSPGNGHAKSLCVSFALPLCCRCCRCSPGRHGRMNGGAPPAESSSMSAAPRGLQCVSKPSALKRTTYLGVKVRGTQHAYAWLLQRVAQHPDIISPAPRTAAAPRCTQQAAL